MKKTRRNIGRAYVCPELEVIVFTVHYWPQVQKYDQVVEEVDPL